MPTQLSTTTHIPVHAGHDDSSEFHIYLFISVSFCTDLTLAARVILPRKTSLTIDIYVCVVLVILF